MELPINKELNRNEIIAIAEDLLRATQAGRVHWRRTALGAVTTHAGFRISVKHSLTPDKYGVVVDADDVEGDYDRTFCGGYYAPPNTPYGALMKDLLDAAGQFWHRHHLLLEKIRRTLSAPDSHDAVIGI